MKKLRVGNPELVKILINKMLEKHNIDYNYIMANQIIDGRVWCTHYEWTQEESNNYKKWFIDFFKSNVSPKLSKKLLEIQWIYYNLMWGLKIKDE